MRSCIEGLASTRIALAILPAGTGNLLATNLGVPLDTAAGVRLATVGGRHRIDVGEVEGRAFAVMAGIGFDAAPLGDASSILKARIGAAAYVLSALRHLRDRPMRLQIRTDEQATRKRQARTVVLGNVGRLQVGVDLLPDDSPDSGQFDVAILAPRTLGHWVALTWGVLRRHRHVHHREVPMQVYTVYAPQHHTPGKVHQTKKIADTDTDDEPAAWSVQPDQVADQHA